MNFMLDRFLGRYFIVLVLTVCAFVVLILMRS
jgi:hypothetical protein